MASDPLGLNSFVENLERYSSGDDNGWAALDLHHLSRRLFGGINTSGVGAYSYPNPDAETSVMPPVSQIPSMVPIASHKETSFVTQVLEKTTLYSGFTAFILPERLHTSYLTYSAAYMVRVEDRDSANRLLMTNYLNADLVRRGYCAFLPSAALHQEESVSHYDEMKVEPPLHYRGLDVAYQPLNLRRLQPEKRLEDALIVYKRIVLPFFPGLDLETLAKIAETEEDAFRRFNVRLSRAFSRLQTIDDRQGIDEIHEEIDEGVENVKKVGRRLAAMRALRDVEMGTFALSLAIATQAPSTTGGMIAGIVGSANLFDLLRSYVDRRSSVEEIRRDDFFVPWLLDGLAENCSDGEDRSI